MFIADLRSLAVAALLASACTSATAACAVPPRPADLQRDVALAVASSAAIFVGEVRAVEYADIATEEKPAVQLVRLTAHAWWKGSGVREVVLHTSNYRHADGSFSREAHEFRYETGQRYLVYAYEYDGKLFANICTRTRRLDRAAGDIGALDAVSAARPSR